MLKSLWSWVKGRPQGTQPDSSESLAEYPIGPWYIYGTDFLRYTVSFVALFMPMGCALYAFQNPKDPGAISVYVPCLAGLLIMQWELNILRLPEATHTVTKQYLDISRVRIVYALLVAVTTIAIPVVSAIGESLGNHSALIDGDLLKALSAFLGFAGVVALRATNASDREQAIAFAVSEERRVMALPEWSSKWRQARPVYPRIWLSLSLVTSSLFVLLLIIVYQNPSQTKSQNSEGGGSDWSLWLLFLALIFGYILFTAPSLTVRIERHIQDAASLRKARICREKNSPTCPGHMTHLAKVGTYEI